MFVDYSSSPKVASLEIPTNVFEEQGEISNNLNDFQLHYSRYVRCQNEDNAKNVNPPCDLNGRDNFSHLKNAYKRLYNSMEKMEKVYDGQMKAGKTPELYEKNEEELEENYEKVLEVRKNLDEKMQYIQEYGNAKTNPMNNKLKRIQLTNILLVILAICLVYFLIFDL